MIPIRTRAKITIAIIVVFISISCLGEGASVSVSFEDSLSVESVDSGALVSGATVSPFASVSGAGASVALRKFSTVGAFSIPSNAVSETVQIQLL